MPLSDCTRSSSEGSRPRPCCHRPIPPPCCSGHCSLPDRSTCARSMAGKRSPPSQSISRLTSPHDQIPSSCWRSRRGNSYHTPDGTMPEVGAVYKVVDAVTQALIQECLLEGGRIESLR